MAGSWRRAMQYLGLVDDDYDDGYYEDYDDQLEEIEPRAGGAVAPAPSMAPRPTAVSTRPQAASDSSGVSVVRTLDSSTKSEGPVLRPKSAVSPSARVHVMEPHGFNDAQEVGDRLRDSQPVILNLQGVDRDLQRRLIDFSSGLAYALGGRMSKAADQVFLLTPTNVSVSEEEKDRLEAEGLYHR